MNFTTFATLAAVFFFLGVAVAYLAKTWEDERKARQSESTARNDAASLGDLARLRRNLHNGALTVEMDGKTYNSAAELDASQQIQVNKVADELTVWLGRQAAAPAQAAGSPEPLSASPEPSPGLPAADGSSGQASPLKPSQVTPGGVAPIKFDLIASMTRALRADVPKFERSQTVAGQVDAILQTKLEDSPYAGRGIRLVDQPDHTLAVMIGLEKYDGVDTVPDEGIRNLIRAAVTEWSVKYLKT